MPAQKPVPQTIKPYEIALAIQDASNLLGVINTFRQVALALQFQKREPGAPVPHLTENPALILIADKISSMMRGLDLMADYEFCRQRLKLEIPHPE